MALTVEEAWAVLREVIRVRNVLYEARRVTETLAAAAPLDRLLADADARLAWVTRVLGGLDAASPRGSVE